MTSRKYRLAPFACLRVARLVSVSFLCICLTIFALLGFCRFVDFFMEVMSIEHRLDMARGCTRLTLESSGRQAGSIQNILLTCHRVALILEVSGVENKCFALRFTYSLPENGCLFMAAYVKGLRNCTHPYIYPVKVFILFYSVSRQL